MLRKAHIQQGIVLLEGLIALLLFMVGVLGVVALQAASVQNSIHATYRADATLLATRAISETTVGTFVEANWKADVTAALPAGSGTYTLAANVVTVKVEWQLPSETSAHKYEATGRVCPNPALTTC